MKILITSDWHLDWSTAGVSRWDDLLAATDEIVLVAVKQKVDWVFNLGDLCDPDRSASGTLRAIARAIHFDGALKKNDVDTLWLTGNHDVVEDGFNTSTLSALAAAGCMVISQPGRVDLLPDDKKVLALPFTARSHAYDPEEVVRLADNADTSPPDIVIGHLNIEGIAPGSETTDLPRGREVFFPLDEINKRFPKALKMNGHYHRRQTFKDIHIPGSLERLTFSEEENAPGYLIVEV